MTLLRQPAETRAIALLCSVDVAATTQRQNIANGIVLGCGGSRMKKTVAIVSLSLAFMSSAMAQERAGDAALGALSGALVLGPVGAVAGALVGYTAGPSIASAWGVRRSSSSTENARGGGKCKRKLTRAAKGRLCRSTGSGAAAGSQQWIRSAACSAAGVSHRRRTSVSDFKKITAVGHAFRMATPISATPATPGGGH